jgi:hypothetical protein
MQQGQPRRRDQPQGVGEDGSRNGDIVRHQSFSDIRRLNIREALVRLAFAVMRLADGRKP